LTDTIVFRIMGLPEQLEVKTTVTQDVSARERWEHMRSAAGFRSDAALERAVGIAPKQIWRWTHKDRDPSLCALRLLKRLLGVSLDALDETIVSLRAEVAAEAARQHIAGGGGGHG